MFLGVWAPGCPRVIPGTLPRCQKRPKRPQNGAPEPSNIDKKHQRSTTNRYGPSLGAKSESKGSKMETPSHQICFENHLARKDHWIYHITCYRIYYLIYIISFSYFRIIRVSCSVVCTWKPFGQKISLNISHNILQDILSDIIYPSHTSVSERRLPEDRLTEIIKISSLGSLAFSVSLSVVVPGCCRFCVSALSNNYAIVPG